MESKVRRVPPRDGILDICSSSCLCVRCQETELQAEAGTLGGRASFQEEPWSLFSGLDAETPTVAEGCQH